MNQVNVWFAGAPDIGRLPYALCSRSAAEDAIAFEVKKSRNALSQAALNREDLRNRRRILYDIQIAKRKSQIIGNKGKLLLLLGISHYNQQEEFLIAEGGGNTHGNILTNLISEADEANRKFMSISAEYNSINESKFGIVSTPKPILG